MEFAESPSVAEVCRAIGAPLDRTAILINDHIVQRAAYEQHRFREGDRVEIVTLVRGG